MSKKLTLNSSTPVLQLVVDNPGLRSPLLEGRLRKRREFLKKVKVISNAAFVPEADRLALALADWVETKYWEHVGVFLDEKEALIPLTRMIPEAVRKAAIQILRGRHYAVTYTEIRNRSGGRFSVSMIKKSGKD